MALKAFLKQAVHVMGWWNKPSAKDIERADAYTRQQLLTMLSNSVNASVFHAELCTRPGTRTRPVRNTTISREYYEILERLGASPQFLAKLHPIVRK